MRSRNLKRLKRLIIPGREVTGVSRGEFLRETTSVQPNGRGQWIIEPKAPRATYQKLKRMMKSGRRKQA